MRGINLYRKDNHMHTCTAGLDISKLTIDAVLVQGDSHHFLTIDNNRQGYQQLLDWFDDHAARPHICMEATGTYYEAAAHYLTDHHIVSVVNPLKIKRYGEAVLSRTKTDKQDARLIADYCAKSKPQTWNKPTKEQARLSKLITCQNQLTGQRTAIKNRLHNVTDDIIKSVHQTLIDTINAQIQHLKDGIAALIAANETMRAKCNRIQSIDGTGTGTSPVIVDYLQTRQFNNVKQYIASIGLCPRENQSGTSVRGRGRLTKYGHRKAKSVYFMPALVAYRNRMYPEFIKRLEAKGKPQKVIITALMRKLATIAYAYHIYHSETVFDRSRYRQS